MLSILSLTSCGGQQSAYSLLEEFCEAYGASGIIYSPEVGEGSNGHISEGLIERVFFFTDGMTDNYAILLNTHIDSPSECGIFVCTDGGEVRACEEICVMRLKILGSKNGFVRRRGRVVYYSTLSDADRAEELFNDIIK